MYKSLYTSIGKAPKFIIFDKKLIYQMKMNGIVSSDCNSFHEKRIRLLVMHKETLRSW